jgi:hypothetical protein
MGLALVACSGHRHPPLGPPPEYERPVVMPWDAGEPIDPLDNLKGEEVTDDDEPAGQSDAGAASEADAADAADAAPADPAPLPLDAGVG